MAFVLRDEGKIYYNVLKPSPANKKSGSNPPTLLMLRGLGRSSRYWLGFDKLMSRHFQVITLDPRGIGRSTQPMHWSDGIEEMAEDCLAVLDDLDIENFHIFGLSLGGMVATAIAAKEPDRIESLILAASSSGDYKAFRISPSLLPKLLLALRLGRFQDELLKNCVPDLVRRSWGPEIQAAWQEILKLEGFPLVTIIKQLRAAMAHTIGESLEAADFPVLILHGSMDAFVPEKNSHELKKLIPRAVLKIIKGAGHEIALGFEEEISRHILDFSLGKKIAKKA